MIRSATLTFSTSASPSAQDPEAWSGGRRDPGERFRDMRWSDGSQREIKERMGHRAAQRLYRQFNLPPTREFAVLHAETVMIALAKGGVGVRVALGGGHVGRSPARPSPALSPRGTSAERDHGERGGHRY